MPIYQLERHQVVSMPLAECWAFFSNPANLAQITPPEMCFVVRSELPPRIHPGLMIRYTVSPLFGIPLTWVTEITQVQEPIRSSMINASVPTGFGITSISFAGSTPTKRKCAISFIMFRCSVSSADSWIDADRAPAGAHL